MFLLSQFCNHQKRKINIFISEIERTFIIANTFITLVKYDLKIILENVNTEGGHEEQYRSTSKIKHSKSK